MIERIKQVKSYANLTTRAFALKLNLNQPSVDRMMKGVYAVNMNLVAAILEHFPEISAEWLMRGDGQMLLQNKDGNCCGDGSQQVTGNQNNLCMIPEKVLIQEQEANAELRRMLADAQSANARLIALLEKYSLK